MTMLDRMRRHKGWLKWSLGIVVVAFVVLYIPSFLSPTGVGAAPNAVIASVDGRDITVAEYQRVYNQQVQSLQSAYGGSVNEDMLRQLGVPQRVVQQLVDEEAVLAEADRLGITVSDAELRERLVRIPGLQENGQFIGDDRYRQLLQMQRPPMRPAEFEAMIRRTLVAEKLQGAVSAWINVSDEEVDREYRRRNEKVKLDLAIFTADKFRSGIDPSAEDVSSYFAAHQEDYRQPEKRRVRFLSIDAEALRPTMTVTPQEVEQRYQQNLQMYQTPDQIRASHILLKTEGKDEAAVKKQAEAILARAKAGEDFAALARQYSEDEGSAAQGGDLDFFGRNAMVKEFEDAAWALEPGQISDLVKTQYGFHIIKLTDKRPASTRSLDEVRSQIEDQIRWEKAQAEATRIADEIAPQIKSPADLERVAQARQLTLGDSGLFSREEPLAGLGFAPSVAAEAFSLDQGKVSGLLKTNQGYAFIEVVEVKPSALPSLDEVREKVRDDVIRTRAVDLARAKAQSMAQAAERGSFASAARSAGVEVKTTDMITRGAAYPEIGVSTPVDEAVFALDKGGTTGPIQTDNAVVVAHVADRQPIAETDMVAARDTLRAELLQSRRENFFGAYMDKAKAKMSITYNNNTLQAVIGG